MLSIDALSGLPFKISPELRVSLGTPDTVIAATASLHDSPLLTNNAKDYPMQNGTGSVSCNSVFVLHLCRFLNQEDLMEREAMVQNP